MNKKFDININYFTQKMTTIYNYKIFCQTENTWVTQLGETQPNICPNDPSHVIIEDSINIVKTIFENVVVPNDGIT